MLNMAYQHHTQPWLKQRPSEDLDGSIAAAVYHGIQEEDFACAAVDALLSMVQSGHTEVLGDVLIYLTQNQHPDWAAELCRLVMSGPDGAAVEERDYASVAAALVHMSQSTQSNVIRQVCTYILEMKDDGNGGTFFDCLDISMVVGHMVESGSPAAGGQILYDIYCDDSEQAHMYQALVPHVLGTLIDRKHTEWAVELSKQLMYEDGDRSIDYTATGWALAQMVYSGRVDWAAAICKSLQTEKPKWYDQAKMLQAVTACSDAAYTEAITTAMAAPPAPATTTAVDGLTSAIKDLAVDADKDKPKEAAAGAPAKAEEAAAPNSKA